MKANTLLLILLIGMISFTGLGHTTTDLSNHSNVVTQSDEVMSKVIVIGVTGIGNTVASLAEMVHEILQVEETFKETAALDFSFIDQEFVTIETQDPEIPDLKYIRQIPNLDKNLNVPFHPCTTYRKARDGLSKIS